MAILAQAEQVSRVSEINGQSRIGIHGNVHPLASSANDRGKVSGSLVLPRVTLVFNRTADQQAQLDELLRQQQDPSSGNYHKWLTPQQFADRFGVSESDMQKAADWLTAQGLTVVERAASRSYVVFSGAAAQIQSTFGTEIHEYVAADEHHFANASMPTLPAGLAGVVLGFRGMNDFRPKPKSVRLRPRFTSSISGNHFVAPDDFATQAAVRSGYRWHGTDDCRYGANRSCAQRYSDLSHRFGLVAR
jgi:subtilase family serine protease